MTNFITASGPLFWPVLIAGLVAGAAAVQYARVQRRTWVPIAVGATVAAVLFSLLGALFGFQRAIAPLGQLDPDQRWIFLLGLGESLNAVGLALVVALVVCVALALGGYRAAKAS